MAKKNKDKFITGILITILLSVISWFAYSFIEHITSSGHSVSLTRITACEKQLDILYNEIKDLRKENNDSHKEIISMLRQHIDKKELALGMGN